MRFDIGPGGAVVILVGLVGLSGVVFGLGLIAGHELAGSEPAPQEAAVAYPVPAPPMSSSAPAPTSAADTVHAGSTAPAPPVSAGSDASAKPPGAESAPAAGAAEVRPRKVPSSSVASAAGAAGSHRNSPAARPRISDSDLAPTTMAPSAEAGYPSPKRPVADQAAASPGDEGTVEAPPVRPMRRKVALANARHQPYSIQVDAMMDYGDADRMAQRLRAKGYDPYIVATELNGRTWYRIRVGHYATPEQAQAAEARLHQEFGDVPASEP